MFRPGQLQPAAVPAVLFPKRKVEPTPTELITKHQLKTTTNSFDYPKSWCPPGTYPVVDPTITPSCLQNIPAAVVWPAAQGMV